ncbi:hypothetical protein ANAPC5_01293 [Anaplasma phagocytophilum]|nr:hypothetical protein ANAPC5_01293 [Anaplasma phagocytophilum]
MRCVSLGVTDYGGFVRHARAIFLRRALARQINQTMFHAVTRDFAVGCETQKTGDLFVSQKQAGFSQNEPFNGYCITRRLRLRRLSC